MTPIAMMDFLAGRLRRVPRWAWISGGLVVLLVPAVLTWLLFSLVGSAWQSGSAMLQQERESLQAILPAAIADAREALPEAATRLRQLTDAAQAEVDTAIRDARQALPDATAEFKQLADAVQSEVDAAVGNAQLALADEKAEAELPGGQTSSVEATTSNN